MPSPKSLLATIRRSLQGHHEDFTRGPISDAVILLAIPMILEISLESVFAVVDMFFVGRLGQNAIATVGLSESVMTLVYSIAIGLSAGATAIVARRVGEKNPEAAAFAGAQSLVLSLVLSLILGILGVFFAAEILRVMGASVDVVRDGTGFARIMFGSSVVVVLLFMINGVFRGAGDAAMAMRSLWIASGVNIVLCPVLIHFMGLEGAAVATLIGRGSGVVYQCYHLAKGDGILRMRIEHFVPDPALMRSVFTIAWPASFQFLIGSGSWIILTRLVAETGGTAASAGYQIAFRCFVFFILPAWGLSNAAATLVGQNLGAREPERAKESVLTTARYSAVLMTLITVILVAFAAPLVSIFTSDELVAGYGVQALRVLGAGFIFYGVGMVMSQALNGAGDTRTPTWINFACFWVFQTPFAYYLASAWGAYGAIVAIPCAHALLAAISLYVFRRGRWMEVKV